MGHWIEPCVGRRWFGHGVECDVTGGWRGAESSAAFRAARVGGGIWPAAGVDGEKGRVEWVFRMCGGLRQDEWLQQVGSWIVAFVVRAASVTVCSVMRRYPLVSRSHCFVVKK